MTKLRICDCCTGLGREPNTVLPLPTRLRGWLIAALMLALVGCQTTTSATPTAVPPPAPTATAAVPTAPAPTPTAPAPAPTERPTAPAVGTSRVDTLKAANAAFGSGDTKTAAGLYERVVNTPPTGEPAATTLAIDDLADFRAMVIFLADGSDDEAQTHLDQLQKRDPSAPLARLGSQLYDQYGMTGQLRGACAQIQPQIATQAAPTLTALQGLGVSVDAATLCTVRQG
jgi:hypothetical protein